MTNAEPWRVLVVDDTPDLRDLLRLALERTGEFRIVAEAENGELAIEASRAHDPDVILLDIAMPVMDGLEALPRIREICPTATVVMLSGFGAIEMSSRALAGGADGYIQKGQSLAVLQGQVRALVAKTASRRSPQQVTAPLQRVEVPPVLDHLELAPLGFLHVRDGVIVRANREASRLLGELAGPCASLAAMSPTLAAHVAGDPEPGAPTSLELGDPPRQIEADVRRTSDGHVIYLQTQAVEEASLLKRVIATAAHEIRNPVSVLMGVAETLSLHGAELTEAERTRMLGAISRQTRLLDNITADLLTAGQAQHGHLTLQLETIDPEELLPALIDDDIDLTMVTDHRPRMLADPMRFQQMLGNLLSNARKYGEPPFHVRVSTESQHVRIDVEDNGQGVPTEFRPRLFQEYSRAAGTIARGTGLGLFVVRALAEAQGGSVTYTPRVPRGSVFSLRLPAVSE